MPGGRSTSSARTTISRRGAAAALLALAAWTTGDLEEAHRWYADGMASLEKAGHISDVIGCAIALADIRLAQGRLREAMRIYERGLRLATEQGAPVLRGAADMHVGISELSRERNDLDAAAQHLLMSRELGEENGLPQNPYRSRVATARIRQAEGDLDGALELLDEAERLYVGDFSPDVRPVAALKARVWVAQGKAVGGVGLGAGAGLSGRGRAQLPARVRARHPGEAAAGPGTRDRADDCDRRGNRAPGAPAASGGGRRAQRERHRDPGRAGARPPGTRRSALRSPRWHARWRWPSRKATSASSSMKGRRWRRC